MAKDPAGAKIKSARLARGLSVAELAKKAGVNPASVYRIEAGAKPQAATYRKLAKALASTKPLPEF
jgi:transcriptional regulator with XRE-family HTH domain